MEERMVSCPSCGNDSPASSLHCVHCGAKLPSAAQKTQFGMPVLRPGAATASKADDGDKSTAEYAAQDLARLAMATKKTPGSALAGLGGLKTGRRPGSLLRGLPQFRGANPSPLTSGEFRLGGAKGDTDKKTPELGLYAGAKRSSLPPEVAPGAEEPAPTVAMQGVTDADLAQAAPAEAEPAPTMAMQGLKDVDLPADDPSSSLGDMAPIIGRTVEERAVEPAQIPDVREEVAAAQDEPAPATETPSTDAPMKAEATSEAPLPKAMRGSERAHHPGAKAGVQQARIEQSSSNGKWIALAIIIAIGAGVAFWLTRG